MCSSDLQGILKSLLQHSSKASILQHSAFFTVQLSHPYMTTGKTIVLTYLFQNLRSFYSVLCSYLVTDVKSPNCCSVAQSCPTLCDLMDHSTSGFPILHHLLEFAPTHVHLDIDAIQPSHPLSLLLLLPPIFPSIRVFSSGSELFIRWLKYWSSSFSISLSKEYSGLISFRID